MMNELYKYVIQKNIVSFVENESAPLTTEQRGGYYQAWKGSLRSFLHTFEVGHYVLSIYFWV